MPLNPGTNISIGLRTGGFISKREACCLRKQNNHTWVMKGTAISVLFEKTNFILLMISVDCELLMKS